MSVFYDGEKLCVQLCRGKNYKQVLELAKLYDGEYIPEVNIFVFPPIKKIAIALREIGYPFDDSARIFLKEKSINEIKTTDDLNLDFKSIDRTKELYPFQKDGVKTMLHLQSNVLLADEMGLGKTPQASSYLRYEKDCFPTLIVCPASLKENWKKEIKTWSGRDACVIEGRTAGKLSKEFLQKYPVIIINYDVLGVDNKQQKQDLQKLKEKLKRLKAKVKVVRTNEEKQAINRKIYMYRTVINNTIIKVDGWCDEIIKFNFKTIIGDEIQYISGIDTTRTRAMNQICNALGESKKIFISGTPYETKTAQFYPALHLLRPDYFNNEYKYKMRYCDPVKTFFGWKFEGLSNAEELHQIISKFMIRRLKKDVLKDLPPKVRSVVPMKIKSSDRKIYDQCDRELEKSIINKEKNALSKLEALKQASFKAKLNSMIQWIKDYLEVNEKLVVFIWHQEACEILEREFANISVSITGKTPSKQRDAIKEKFQNDPKVRLFIGQIKSAGVGLTLTKSRAVAFLEFGNTAPGMEQAEDRVHRIGQKADSVLAYYLVMENSVDESIMEVLNRRNKDLKMVLNNEDEDLFSEEKQREFSKLVLSEYKKRKKIA